MNLGNIFVVFWFVVSSVFMLPISEDRCPVGQLKGDKLYLWAIQKTPASPTSWLLGTLHVPYPLVPLPWQAKKAFEMSQELVKEIVVDKDKDVDCDIKENKTEVKSQPKEYDPFSYSLSQPDLVNVGDGQSQQTISEDDLRKAIRDQLIFIIDQIPSWYPNNTQQQREALILIRNYAVYFSTQKIEAAGWARTIAELSNKSILNLRSLNYTVLDKYLEDQARANGKKIAAAESTFSHCNSQIYSTLSKETQEEMLMEQLEELKKTRNQSTNTHDILINQYNCLNMNETLNGIIDMEDVDTSNLTDSELNILTWYNDELLYKRNVNMARIIEQRVSQSNKTIMFAFGALHFLGSASVVDFLVQKNFTVKRINVSDDLSWLPRMAENKGTSSMTSMTLLLTCGSFLFAEL